MPHLILEHNLNDEDRVSYVCKKLHGCLSRHETVKLSTIKTRSLYVSNVVLGDGVAKGLFAHLNLKLLPGRDESLKKKMSESLLDTMKHAFKEDGLFSVEVNELESYSK